jgi:DNA-binding LacI/PurR family transcriptional regulator
LTATSRPKIADVAAVAGVSIPTVSKVLNGRTHVAEATRAKVQKAAAQLAYTKRPSASDQPGLLQIVVSNMDSQWILEALDSTEIAAARLGYSVIYCRAENTSVGAWRKLREPSVNRLAGVILLAPRRGSKMVDTLRMLGIPTIAIDPESTHDLNIPSVAPASFTGALAAVGHLLELGHRRIAIITGNAHPSGHGRARYAAYAAALHEAGISVDPQLVRDGIFAAESGRQEAKKLLELPEPPTAIFAASDTIAMGILNAAAERGISVPDQLSIVGFDDIAQSANTSPPLTTIRQPLAQLTAMAVGILADQQEGSVTATPTALEIATELVIRESTAPLLHRGSA